MIIWRRSAGKSFWVMPWSKEKANVSALNQRMIEHNILKREFEINQQLYESLLQRLKDATLSASLQATNVHVIDPATPPVQSDPPEPAAQYGRGPAGRV